MRKQLGVILPLLLIFMIIASTAFAASSGGKGKSSGPKAPYAGDKAPLFKLTSLDGKEEWALEKKIGERPIVIFFGSYT